MKKREREREREGEGERGPVKEIKSKLECNVKVRENICFSL